MGFTLTVGRISRIVLTPQSWDTTHSNPEMTWDSHSLLAAFLAFFSRRIKAISLIQIPRRCENHSKPWPGISHCSHSAFARIYEKRTQIWLHSLLLPAFELRYCMHACVYSLLDLLAKALMTNREGSGDAGLIVS